MPTARATYPHVTRATEYAREVAEGKRNVCRIVRQACERHLNDLARWKGKDQPFAFDNAAANRVCAAISQFPHTKGVWASARKKLELEAWQSFVLASVFGWKTTATKTRRFRVAYIEVPRKNAKSTITSALGLYLVACDGEAGAYVVSAANARHQANLVFNDAQSMARREPGYLSTFGVDVLAHTIVQNRSSSKFEALSAEHSNLDGLNLHAALIDELHAHPTRGLWDVLETATGSRSQPLIWAITTAGVNRASVCYDQRSHVIDILNGVVEDESYFGIVYTRDDDDDPWIENTWSKCNPNYGVSIYPETIAAEAKRAQHMPSAQATFLQKHLNIWTNTDVQWLPAGSWERCCDPSLDLEDFARMPCFIGLDLARKWDITALILAFPPWGSRDWWAVFGRYYLPEQTIARAENAHYQGWETSGHLIATAGIITDYDYTLDNLADFCARFEVREIAFDPFDASPVYNAIDKRGITTPRVEVKQNAINMSPAMVELEGLILGRKIRHDGDPVLAWMFSNVRAKRKEDLMQPSKESEEKKIDGVTALLMCISRGMRRGPQGTPGIRLISMED